MHGSRALFGSQPICPIPVGSPTRLTCVFVHIKMELICNKMRAILRGPWPGGLILVHRPAHRRRSLVSVTDPGDLHPFEAAPPAPVPSKETLTAAGDILRALA